MNMPSGMRCFRPFDSSLIVRRPWRHTGTVRWLICAVALLWLVGSNAIAAGPDSKRPFVGTWQIKLTQTSGDVAEEGMDEFMRRINGPLIQSFGITYLGETYSIEGLGQISDVQFNDTELSFTASDNSPSPATTEYYFRVVNVSQISGEWVEHHASLNSVNAYRSGTLLGMRVAANREPSVPVVPHAVPRARPGDTIGAPRAENLNCSADCTRSWMSCGRACGFGLSEGRPSCNAECRTEYNQCKSSC
ncbi:hypothetical protein LQG66_03500 [Bradyrhizobium ontarionense]|uniref:Lipocalin-like domain-containing protein n=1 Tax=Bradyrhizobium ontarionense TaxID=2898149 RepID=A0ABY3REH9_9BRAD|nr:hypothetical protein [Bradyrhizobium sp. A19]UFZ05397.1 hypothetical protein LQG66_03500 [Bradyrhizobium sp. A19]